MAIHILQNQYPSAGYEIGTGLGKGLGAALQGLAEGKASQMQWQRSLPALQSLGFTTEQARELRHLPEQARNAIIQYKLEEPNRVAFQQALQQTLGIQEPSLVQNLQQLGISTENQQRQPTPEEAAYIKSLSSPFTSPMYQQMPGATPSFAQPQAPQQQPQGTQQAQQMQQQAAMAQQKAAVQPQGFFKGGLNAPQAMQLAQLAAQQKQAASKEEASRFKETKEIRQKILDEAKSAKDQLRDLNRMSELETEGKLDTPGYIEFLKRSGLDIPALSNPGSEEFQKIAQNFLRDAKTFYGGRVSNFEVEQFLKTIPSLSQSPEGRKRVIANLKNMANTKLAYADAMKEITKENKGIPPFDLSEQIYDRIDTKLDTLAEKFKADIAKPSPKGQNRLITALQAAGGSAAKIAAPVVAGAALGSVFGPQGTAAGAGLGGLYGLGSSAYNLLKGS